MAGMYGASEVAGPGKGKNRPNSKVKVDARKAARKASGMSAQKFYVTTRMAEAAKGGKTVNAKDLRKKFQSGDVARKGFGAPKKKTGGTGTGSSSSGSSSSGSSSSGSSSKVTGTGSSSRRSATQNMKGVKGYSLGKVTPSTKKSTSAPSTSSSSPKASGTSSTKLQDDKIKMLEKLPPGKLRDNKLKEQMILRDKIRNKPTTSGTKLQDDKIKMLEKLPAGKLRDDKLKAQTILRDKIRAKDKARNK